MIKFLKTLLAPIWDFLLRYKVIIALVFFVLYILFWDHYNVFYLFSLKHQIKLLDQEKRKETDQLKKDMEYLNLLKDDDATFEKYIRENYYFHYPKEEVFIIKYK